MASFSSGNHFGAYSKDRTDHLYLVLFPRSYISLLLAHWIYVRAIFNTRNCPRASIDDRISTFDLIKMSKKPTIMLHIIR